MLHSRRNNPGRPPSEERCALRCNQILDAAVKVFGEHGYSEANMQMLCDALQVGRGTIYRYFVNKEDLFLKAVDRTMLLLRQAVDASIGATEDPFQRIARAIQAYLEFFANKPAYVELLIQERAHFKGRKKPTYLVHREASGERWGELYRQLIAGKRVRAIPVERILTVLGNLVYGTMFINYLTGQPRPPEQPEQQAKDILDIVFHGILTDQERQRRCSD
jgi:AcrR family transcriptional regulator